MRREGAGGYLDDHLVWVDLRGEGALGLLSRARGALTIRTDDAALGSEPMRDAMRALARRHDVAVVLTRGATDVALTEVAVWSRLRRLTVMTGEAHVTDAGVAALSQASRLEVLYLAGARAVSGAGVEALAGLRSLREVNLLDTAVGDAGLAHLAGLTQLRSLMLGGSQVTSAGLVHLRRLTQLRALGLERTSVDDAGMEHVGRLSRLERLSLSETQVGDASVPRLLRLRRLERLSLDAEHVSEESATTLRSAFPELVLSVR